MSIQAPPAPTASALGPCPTIIQNVGRPGTGSLPRTIASPDHPHVSRSSGYTKTILQGTVKGKRRRGRQKRRWEDNIKEWTGMDLANSARAAANRTIWKGIVAKSSVVPRRPSKVMGYYSIERK